MVSAILYITLQLLNCSGLGLECHGFGLGLVVYGLGLGILDCTCALVNIPAYYTYIITDVYLSKGNSSLLPDKVARRDDNDLAPVVLL